MFFFFGVGGRELDSDLPVTSKRQADPDFPQKLQHHSLGMVAAGSAKEEGGGEERIRRS